MNQESAALVITEVPTKLGLPGAWGLGSRAVHGRETSGTRTRTGLWCRVYGLGACPKGVGLGFRGLGFRV